MSDDPMQPAAPAVPTPLARSRRRRAFWWLVGVILLALATARVVVVFTSFRGIPIGYSRAKTKTHLADGYYDFRGAIHTHSHWSHDSHGTFAQIAAAARRVDLDFVIVTDHPATNGVEGGVAEARAYNERHRQPLFIVGSEIGSRVRGILAFPLTRSFTYRNDDVADAAEKSREQGAVIFVSHMELYKQWGATTLDGVEIYNLHADFRDEKLPSFILRALVLPPGALLKSIISNPVDNLRRWDEMLALERMPVLGGCDAHATRKHAILSGSHVGTYERLFKIVTTHVFVKELSETALVEALRAGRAYVTMDVWRDGSGFNFTATDGQRLWWMGEETLWNDDMILSVTVPYYGTVHLIKDGRTIATQQTNQLDYKPPSPGVYRVEVYLRDKLAIISNPIYLR